MHTIELVTTDGKSIYCGTHNSLKEAIEFAIQKNISLDGIDLSYANLDHINLDGVILRNAYFKFTSLKGANMSEAKFFSCDFTSANLEGACLCYSDINHCNFRLCALKDMDVGMASLVNCEFEGLSAFHVRFQSAHERRDLIYHHFSEQYSFSEAPTVIQLGDKAVILFEKDKISKCFPHTFEYGSVSDTVVKWSSYKIQSLVDLKNDSM